MYFLNLLILNSCKRNPNRSAQKMFYHQQIKQYMASLNEDGNPLYTRHSSSALRSLLLFYV